MSNPDLFESYVNMSLPKDISFVGSVKIPSSTKTSSLSDLLEYRIIKTRVNDFSSDQSLMGLYHNNPLDSINSEILKKDLDLRKELDSRILKLRNDVDAYSGSHPRKLSVVESELEFLSVVDNYVGSDIDFDSVKDSIRKKMYDRLASQKKPVKNILLSGYRNIAYAAVLLGGLYLGHSLFPKEKRLYTTISKDIYEDASIPLDKKVKQFAYDRNLLLKYESELVQGLIDENQDLKGESND